MRLRLVFLGVLASLMLAGCTLADLVGRIRDTCGFLANKGDIIRLITKIAGSFVPGGTIAIETGDAVVKKVCEAVEKKKQQVQQTSVRGVVVKTGGSKVYVRGRIVG